jgi:hypothetical protein
MTAEPGGNFVDRNSSVSQPGDIASVVQVELNVVAGRRTSDVIYPAHGKSIRINDM